MQADILIRYVDAVYRYATHRTFTIEEAEDLSQEILETALRELPRLRDDASFEPWLWGIARNVSLAFRRRMGKQRAMFTYDLPESLPLPQDDMEDEAIRADVRRRIVLLSAACRDILVLYYYDGLSVADIAWRTGLPEGTVTWRLSEGRRKLKKECETMEITALHPKKLRIDIYGVGNFGPDNPFPDVYISDALSQNILINCYEGPATVEELAKATGVPAYYVEDRIANLLDHRAIIEVSRGKYRTDMLIWTDRYGQYCQAHALEAIRPILPRMQEAMTAFWQEAMTIPFHRGRRNENDLFYILNCAAFHDEMFLRRDDAYPPIPPQKDGMCWRYVASMETGEHQRLGMTVHACTNNCQRERYSHTSFEPWEHHGSRTMMYDDEINICQEVLETGDTQHREQAAAMLEKGLLCWENGQLMVDMPALTREQRHQLGEMEERYLAPIFPAYKVCVEHFLTGYRKLFPKHLQDDAARQCYHMYFALLKTVYAEGQRTGAFPPETYGTPWDILTQF